jgi:hypothetical protein
LPEVVVRTELSNDSNGVTDWIMVEVADPAILDYLLDLLNCQGLNVVFHDFELELLPRHLPWGTGP